MKDKVYYERREEGWYESDTCHFLGETLEEAASSALDSCGCYVGFYDADVKIVALLEVFRRYQEEVGRDTQGAIERKWLRLKDLGMLDENEALNPLFYFAATILDHKGLIEWGCSVRGSWPTERGEQFLEAFGSLLDGGDL